MGNLKVLVGVSILLAGLFISDTWATVIDMENYRVWFNEENSRKMHVYYNKGGEKIQIIQWGNFGLRYGSEPDYNPAFGKESPQIKIEDTQEGKVCTYQGESQDYGFKWQVKVTLLPKKITWRCDYEFVKECKGKILNIEPSYLFPDNMEMLLGHDYEVKSWGGVGELPGTLPEKLPDTTSYQFEYFVQNIIFESGIGKIKFAFDATTPDKSPTPILNTDGKSIFFDVRLMKEYRSGFPSFDEVAKQVSIYPAGFKNYISLEIEFLDR